MRPAPDTRSSDEGRSGEPGRATAHGAAAERLAEVSRLATLLAERVLAAQAAGHPVPEAHVHALIDAAIVLDKYEVALPPSLARIVDQIDAAQPAESEAGAGLAEEDDAGRLAWLLRPFQGSKG
ncbi:hypothetical protein [Methylobacterium sp. J-068]|uniref:hypothetical protein n=1 Tax=Methylobacterium sp. J-068 TaxID=2836649 RepID=UPI001FBAE4E2|nr:hypothetical protein [Methylobacterium sp. J-068]MCJ2037060.1 hypothetical protein [Methylobacterium sp. J-068]